MCLVSTNVDFSARHYIFKTIGSTKQMFIRYIVCKSIYAKEAVRTILDKKTLEKKSRIDLDSDCVCNN